MNNIKFILFSGNSDYFISTYLNIEVKYEKTDYSLICKDGYGDGILCFPQRCLEFDFDIETKRICGISGYHPTLFNNTIEPIHLENIEKSGILCVDSDIDFQKAVGYSFDMNDEIGFDKTQNILVLGKYKSTMPLYQFLKNAYIQIINGTIQSVLISNIKN